MSELFGIPVGSLLAILAIALAATVVANGLLAFRNPILVRLGVRSAARRPGRTSLIVVGLMLATTIIAAALTTGDTVNHTIKSTAVAVMGNTDETITARGAIDDIPGELGAARPGYFPESVFGRVDAVLRDSDLTDGATPAIIEQVALNAPVQRQNEPGATLFGADPERMAGFAPIARIGGGVVALGDLAPDEAFLNRDAAEALQVQAGDRVLVFAGRKAVPLRVREVVTFDGAATADSALLVSLRTAQRVLAVPGEIMGIAISNRGGAISGVGLTDEVTTLLTPTVEAAGLELTPVKRDALDAAEEAGNTFMTFFTTFGTFSIAAGILLIFLIFVMLAAERRGELGIARAVGTRRGHLVQMFVFEGMAYDVAAAVVGAALGAGVAYGMVLLMAKAFGASDEDAGLQIEYAVSARSLAIAFGLGVLMTLVVVAISAWRVSVMTIATAIRNLPEAPTTRKRRTIVGGIGVALGALLTFAGWTNSDATPLLLGVSLVLVGLVPILCALRLNERVVYTAAGLALIFLWLVPWSWYEEAAGRQLKMDFSTWIVAGLMVVVGAVWVLMHNADVLLALFTRAFGRVRGLAPVIRVAVAYPLAGRFRTGTTLAMFTLVVFTLVTGTASSMSFLEEASRLESTGGGFDIRAGTGSTAAVEDMRAALAARGVTAREVTAVGSQAVLAVDAKQLGTKRPYETYHVRAVDDGFLANTTFKLGALARGYETSADVWRAMRANPRLAVVDSQIVQRRANFGAPPPESDFRITGFYYDDATSFEPTPVVLRDPQTGRLLRVTVVGVLAETAPLEMLGLTTSRSAADRAFPGRLRSTIHYFELADGIDADALASRLESMFVASGMEAESIEAIVKDAKGAALTFNRLILGFMGLGLVVGVAALGVISARSVVERRQQIGVLRALGFRRGMVQAMFLLESSFVALTAILVGAGLGLILAYNIVEDTRSQPSWSDISLVVPWSNLAVIFAVVYLVALAATFAPALRASRIKPAEALRYQ